MRINYYLYNMSEFHDIADKAAFLVRDKNIKDAVSLIVNFIGFKTEADKKRAAKYVKESILYTKKHKGDVSEAALLFCLSGLSEKKQRDKGKFK